MTPQPAQARSTPAGPDVYAGLKGAGYAEDTCRTYSAAWSAFTRWAAQYDDARAFPADLRTVMAYVASAASGSVRTGHRSGPWAVSSIEHAVAAIRAVHQCHDLPDPTDDPVMDDLRAGVRRALSDQRPVPAVPIRPDGMRLLLPEPAVIPPHVAGALVSAQLAVVEGHRPDDVAALHRDDVVIDPVGEAHLRLGQTRVTWTCRGHDACPHCALATLAAAGSGRLLQPPAGHTSLASWCQWARTQIAPVTAARPAGVPGTDDPLPVLLWRLDPSVARDWQARALLLTAWHKGLRPKDWGALQVAQFREQGSQILLALSRAGRDPGDGTMFSYRRTTDPALCPVTALRVWLPVAAAIAEVSAEEVWPFGSLDGERPLAAPMTPAAARGFVRRWQQVRGLPPVFGSLSLRTGFVATALEAGVPLADLRFVLRHRKVETTQRLGRPHQAAARLATDVLAGSGVCGPRGGRS